MRSGTASDGSAPNLSESSTIEPTFGTLIRTSTRAPGACSAILSSSYSLSKVVSVTPLRAAAAIEPAGLMVLAKMIRSGPAPAASTASSSALEATSNPVPAAAAIFRISGCGFALTA